MTHPTDDRQVAPRGILQALAALSALAVLVLMVPLLLLALTQALPLDVGALSPAAWGRADDGRLLLLAIVAAAWVAWVVMVLTVGLETWAALRRVPTPTLPGMAVPQRMAAALVAAVLVALSPTVGAPAAGAASGAPGGLVPVASSVVPPARASVLVAAASGGAESGEATRVGAQRFDLEDPRERARTWGAGQQVVDRSPIGTAPTVTTQRHDTLWLLAEQHLGAGERYVEIVELNRGQAQPDGRSLGDDGRLYPGWTLALPADAVVEAARPERHRVVRGDTLWQIAEDELGDPLRFAEIAQANRGDLQPDGRRLEDPNLILPGWVLEVPGSAASAAQSAPDASPGVGETGRASGDASDDSAEGTSAEASTVEPAEAATGRSAAVPVPTPDSMAPLDRAPSSPSAPSSSSSPSTSSASSVPSTPSSSSSPSASSSVWSPSTPSASSSTAPPAEASPSAGEEGSPEGPAVLDRGSVARPGARQDALHGSATDATANPATPPAPAAAPAPAPPAPAATPALANAPSAAASPGADESSPDTAGNDSAAILLPAGGAVASLLLAGVGAELVRRRRQFQRHRRPGERMPVSGLGAQQVERAARSATYEPGFDLLDRALVQLAEEAEVGGHPLPDVRVVRVGVQSVALDLAAPSGPAIAPFVASDDMRWVLAPELLVAEPPDRPRALAGLVTLGFAGPETVLLNLESVGTVAVHGPKELVGGLLRGLAADLAFGPSSALTERLLCVADPVVAAAVEAGDIGVERDPLRAAAALAAAMAASAESAAAAGGSDAQAGDPLLIVLCDHALDVRVPPRSGCALVTTAPVVGAGATIVVDDSGTAVLLPEREHLTPQHLTRTTTGDIVEALSATNLPGSDLPGTGLAGIELPGADLAGADLAVGGSGDHGSAAGQAGLWESHPSASEVIDLRENASVRSDVGDTRWRADQRLLPLGLEPAGPGHDPAAAVPRVLVLGEVLVENAEGKCESTRIGRLAETAAFVLLNPGARPSELQGALWPGRRSNPQTCRQMISRARTWLGRTDAGEPYLMTFAESEGRLRLRPEVGSDWADFQGLADLGLCDPEDTANLTAALALVRGRPFGAVASRELPWADLHINEMISLIGDVAHALAVRHERAGRLSAARDAALRGLRTESESEVLEEIVARTVI